MPKQSQQSNKKRVEFNVYYPGGNTTALVSSKVSLKERIHISRRIMSNYPDIEQVGFISKKDHFVKLDMMGGEFCGNAAKCCVMNFLPKVGKERVALKVSGFPKQLKGFRLKKEKVMLSLPPTFLRRITEVREGYLIDLYGISFLLTESDHNTMHYKNYIKRHVHKSPAMGVISYKKLGSGIYSIKPWVWVKLTNSLVQESACGSGSIALSWLLYTLTGKTTYQIVQPTQEISKVSFSVLKGKISKLTLNGKVEAWGKRLVEY